MRLNIGLIIYGDLNILSGGYLYDKKLVEYFRFHGIDPVVFSQPQGRYFAHLKDNFNRRLIRQIQAFSPDLLLQDELNHPSLFILNHYLKKQCHLPIISIVHHLYSSELDSNRHKAFFRWIEKSYLQTVDGFIFNSYATRQVVEEFTNRSENSVIAYPGKDNITFNIDAEFIKRRCKRERPLQIIFVGNIIPRKSLHVLINGLSLLPRDTWQLTVVGDTGVAPAYFEEIKALTHVSEVENAIRFLGKVSKERLQSVMLESDVLAVPSLYEGFGIVYVEALGAGLPVIAGTLGGAKEIIQSGKNGYLVSQNENEITEIIGRFIQNRFLLEEISLAAYQSYAQFPTWEQSMERVLRYIKGLIR